MTVGRNHPCPCGSGKRYKECHGNFTAAGPTADVDTAAAALLEGQRYLNAADVAHAESICQRVLDEMPDHPEALRLLGRCHLERHEIEAALRNLLRAVKSPELASSSRSAQRAIWTDLSNAFMQTLSGLDVAVAATRRVEYRLWQDTLTSKQNADEPLVSVVLVCASSAATTCDALESVYQQNYRKIELIVVSAALDSNEGSASAGLLQACPFPYRTLVLPGASEAALFNAGARAATGAFVNVLPAPHAFAKTRITTLVERIVNRSAEWGFADVEFFADRDPPAAAESDSRAHQSQEQLAAIADADTVGYSLIHQFCVAVAVGNLFFSRALFDRVAGFRDLRFTCTWDFCLRAVWFAEPIHVRKPLYRHSVASSPELPVPTHAEFAAAQLALFAEFYGQACSEDAVPPNRFAPCVRHWGLEVFKTAFAVGHVLAFPVDRLEALADTILRRRAQHAAVDPKPGVNLVGLAFGEFGLSESLRGLAKACSSGGIPFTVRDLDLRLDTRQADHSVGVHVADELCHHCSVYCVNPDLFRFVRPLMDAATRSGRYNVGYWYWELEQVPREWEDALEHVDETWAATEFIRDTMRRATTKPVIKIPPPIEIIVSRQYERAEFGLPEGRFLYLFSFDFHSFARRKNPEGAIAAFRRAFYAGRRDVGLVVKSINGGKRPDKLREIQELVAGDDRIVMIDGFLSRDQVYGLQSVTDAFISLHRAEGFGLGLAEAMYLGKPVIATAYSGNLEFMDEHNSCLVDYALIPVNRGEYLYHDDRFRWADPDIEQAADFMRRLVDDAEYRARLAERGQHDIQIRFTRANTAALMRQRLQELGLL
jgi:glycosyltransferase involved in cell wall biosynthesis